MVRGYLDRLFHEDRIVCEMSRSALKWRNNDGLSWSPRSTFSQLASAVQSLPEDSGFNQGCPIPGARTPGRPHFVRWYLIFLGYEYWTRCITPFWRLQFWEVDAHKNSWMQNNWCWITQYVQNVRFAVVSASSDVVGYHRPQFSSDFPVVQTQFYRVFIFFSFFFTYRKPFYLRSWI